MDLARQYAREGVAGEIDGETILLSESTNFCADDPFLIWAHGQTAGRGRFRDRKWVSNPGDGLYFTFGFRPTLPSELVAALPLIVGVIAHSALVSLGVNTALKWPNDILAVDSSGYPGRKLGGVLVETSSDGPVLADVFIGVGINLKFSSEGEAELAHAVDLRTLIGREILAEVVLAEMVRSLVSGLNLLEKIGAEYFLEEWKRYSYHQGKAVSVVTQSGIRVDGIQLGLGANGSLQVQSTNGIVEEITSGEIG
jgi:BirA family biotin operon repressor/biotin-[acetyl-CoA-carboxylase] ligase